MQPNRILNRLLGLVVPAVWETQLFVEEVQDPSWLASVAAPSCLAS